LIAVKRAVGGLSRGLGSRRVPVGNTGFDIRHINVGVSPISNALLGFLDYEEIRRRRRSNYLRLAATLQGTPVFPVLHEGVCPLFFPLLVRDKHASAERLWRRGIGAVEFWNEGDGEAASAQSLDALFLRRHVLELPIHQDVSSSQLEHIAREASRLELM
jgi:perosamine synthetase